MKADFKVPIAWGFGPRHNEDLALKIIHGGKAILTHDSFVFNGLNS